MLTQDKNLKIEQTSGANNETKHSEIERFSSLNERIITQKSLSIVNKFSDLH